MMENPVQRAMFLDATRMNVVELQDLFNVLERKGKMHRKDFLKGLENQSKDVQERHVLKIEKRLATIEEKINQVCGHLLGHPTSPTHSREQS